MANGIPETVETDGLDSLRSSLSVRGLTARAAMSMLKKDIDRERRKGTSWAELSEKLARLGVQVTPKRMSRLYGEMVGKNRPAKPKGKIDAPDYGVTKESLWKALSPLVGNARNMGASKSDLARVFSAAGVRCSRKSFDRILEEEA